MFKARLRRLLSLGTTGKWAKFQLIADVPDELACCEFECRKPHCAQGHWESCHRRLAYAAALATSAGYETKP